MQEVTMARPTSAQASLLDPSPPPVRMPELVRVEVLAQLRILLDEAAAVPGGPGSVNCEGTGNDQDHG
jgi:hypothetical protein